MLSVRCSVLCRQPACDPFRPLNDEAIGRHQEVIEHQLGNLVRIFETVCVEVHEGETCFFQIAAGEGVSRQGAPDGRPSIQVQDVEGGAGDLRGHAETLGEPLHKGRLASAQIAMENKRGVRRKCGRQPCRQPAGLLGGIRQHAGTELSENAHAAPPGLIKAQSPQAPSAF